MKLVLVAALLLACALAVTPTKGTEIVKQLQGIDLDGEVFVILFYDPTCCADPERTLNEDVKKDLMKKVLSTANGKKYIFYEVDTSDKDMTPVTDLLQVDSYQTMHGPSVFIGCSGSGFWAHGKDAADKVAKKASQFDTIKTDAMKKIKARDELINRIRNRQ